MERQSSEEKSAAGVAAREGDGAGCAEAAEVDAVVMVGEETVTVTG